jgi:hypothetical protein
MERTSRYEKGSPLGAGRKPKLSVEERKRRVAVGDLCSVFKVRYADAYSWHFPDDDAGREDLMILAHHYAGNLAALPRIVRRRAPWADADAVEAEVSSNPRRYSPMELGRLLNFTGAEWRARRTRMIAPVDMSKAERIEFSSKLYNAHRRIKRRCAGMQSRKQYLTENSASRERPWEAEGIHKATWYRRRKRATGLADSKLTLTEPHLSQPNPRVTDGGPRPSATPIHNARPVDSLSSSDASAAPKAQAARAERDALRRRSLLGLARVDAVTVGYGLDELVFGAFGL